MESAELNETKRRTRRTETETNGEECRESEHKRRRKKIKKRRRTKPKPRDEVDWAIYRLRAYDRIINACLRRIKRTHTRGEYRRAQRAAAELSYQEFRRFTCLLARRAERRMARCIRAGTADEAFAALCGALYDCERLADLT